MSIFLVRKSGTESITRKLPPPPGGHVFLQIDIYKTNHFTKFHDDWAKNVPSRETNVLTKFHENWAKNVTSRVFTCVHYIHIVKKVSFFLPNIIGTNLLTKFHEDQTKNVASRVFTRKTAQPTGGHVSQRTGTTLELNQHIIKTNILTHFELHRDFIGTKLLTKFHEDPTIIVASRVFTNKCGRTDGRTGDGQRPVTKAHLSNQGTIKFAHLRGTNILVKFHDDWAKNVTSRVFTSFFYYINIRKLPPPGSHVIQLTGTIFKLNSHIKETNVLTKFHENWAKNVTSRVFTCFHYIHIEKNAPPTGGHIFSPTWTIFELQKSKTAPPPWSHVIQLTGTIFELHSQIKETNVLTKFHENWAKNVTSRVFTCFHYIHIEKNAPPTGGHIFSPTWTIFKLAKIVTSRVFTRKTAPPTGGHVFQRTGTTFELNQHIIKTNILTNFELDQDFIGTKLLTKVFTNKCGRMDGQTTDKDRSQKLT
ncbi:hypothetical protein DPMN_179098 [Dreissena polymorpha]|uniref:Uncharacterized protein n=1 Tax=Dreissena polymorpha TaxID=45954 RepID=A0A9D4IKG7_DREPO|nr:hypothetical protein DPMN_179098 [Dreissena polymorpha]